MSMTANSPLCLSALYFMNLRGDVLMERQYRDDVTCVNARAQSSPPLDSIIITPFFL